MEKFVARSGRMVKPGREDGALVFANLSGYLDRESVFDAEEYFQARRDEELGRWRWPVNPDFVVYPRDGWVSVVCESTGASLAVTRRDVQTLSDFDGAAAAYFETHPEPRPWHDAAEGEFWRVSHSGMVEVCQVREGRFEGVDGMIGSRVSMPVTHLSITDAAQMVVAESSSQAGLQSFKGRAS